MSKAVLLRICGFGILLGVVLNPFGPSTGQEPKDPSFRGRLPAYYGEIVTEAQRQKIYDVQEKYAKQIAALKGQLEALENKRDAEIEAVLNAEQKGKLKKVRDEAAAKRKKTAEKKVADAKGAK